MTVRTTPQLATLGWRLRDAVVVLFAHPAFGLTAAHHATVVPEPRREAAAAIEKIPEGD
jgi:hypothetical protein